MIHQRALFKYTAMRQCIALWGLLKFLFIVPRRMAFGTSSDCMPFFSLRRFKQVADMGIHCIIAGPVFWWITFNKLQERLTAFCQFFRC